MFVNAVHNDCSNGSEDLLIQDIRSLLFWFNNASSSYVSKNCNNVAHIAAKLAFSKSISAIWLDNFPSVF